MGLPGFFAWLIKEYKTKNFILEKLDIKPEILYIDANCLFHPQCFKILEYSKNAVNLESNMIKRIINYLNFLIEFTNVEQVFIAVDGVAPLAKISQQRKRRFKTVQENYMREEIKKKYNKESLVKWSNSKITPGTQFMEKLHQEILKYIDKIIKNKKVKKCIYSSYHTPGEGEHKILAHIKENNNDSHIIYGLDADLFFLAMASQKKNIYLLREYTFLNNTSIKYELYDIVDDVKEPLRYISIDQTKDCYYDHIKKNITPYIEHIEQSKLINDFIFLCYLLGNDFLPHIPSIDIKKNGLDFLLECYCLVYNKINQNKKSEYYHLVNLTDKIKINYKFLLNVLHLCSKKETYYFTKILPNYIQMHEKKSCPYTDNYLKEIWELDNLKNINVKNDIIQYGKVSVKEWKIQYYNHYFGSTEFINKICYNFFEGLEWIAKYYFESCASWTWQYKYTHAPYISDLYYYLKYKKKINIIFDLDKPLEPCIQLLSVLPPTYSNELPLSYQKIMNSDNEKIINMFPDPLTIKIDYLYKEQLWQCIPIIPYLNINIIKKECKKYKLLPNEKKLNKTNKEFIFTYE
jgi:5'-3' exoribonuclease 2